jgi:putative salt-induced outer membrane protein YdiY
MASPSWFRTVGAATFAALVLAVAPASADVIALNNGDRITGNIEKITPDGVQVATPYAGTVTLKMAAVRSLASTHPVSITDTAGAVHSAIVGPTPDNTGWKEVATAPANPDAIAVPYVAAPPPAPAPAPVVSLFGPKWQNELSLGLLNTSGNTDQTEFTGELDFHYTDKPHELTIKFDGAYGNTNGKLDNALLAGDVIYRRELPELMPRDRWYLFAENHDIYDGIKGISFRTIDDVGLGFYVWRGKKLEVDVRAGPGVTYEKLFDGTSDVDPNALAGLRAVYQFSDRVSLGEEAIYSTSVTDDTRYQASSETALGIKLPELQRGFGLKTTFRDDYDNTAGMNGHKRNDTKFVVALTLDF